MRSRLLKWFAFAILAATAIQGWAQGLTGTWGFPNSNIVTAVFESDGKWSYATVSGQSKTTIAGKYTVSGNRVTLAMNTITTGSGAPIDISAVNTGYHATYAVVETSASSTLTLTLLDQYSGTDVTPVTGAQLVMVRKVTAPASGQTNFTVQTGIIPQENVTVTTAGTLQKLTVTVDLKVTDLFSLFAVAATDAGNSSDPKRAELAASALNAFAASGYKVFVIAMVPGSGSAAATLLQLPPSPKPWEALSFPLSAFLENVAVSSQDSRVRIEIIRDTDLSKQIGTEYYIGYGTSDVEMLQNSRYRGIYKVTVQ